MKIIFDVDISDGTISFTTQDIPKGKNSTVNPYAYDVMTYSVLWDFANNYFDELPGSMTLSELKVFISDKIKYSVDKYNETKDK